MEHGTLMSSPFINMIWFAHVKGNRIMQHETSLI
jgi:hypothetical protein